MILSLLAPLANAGSEIGDTKMFGLGAEFGNGTYINVSGKYWLGELTQFQRGLCRLHGQHDPHARPACVAGHIEHAADRGSAFSHVSEATADGRVFFRVEATAVVLQRDFHLALISRVAAQTEGQAIGFAMADRIAERFLQNAIDLQH